MRIARGKRHTPKQPTARNRLPYGRWGRRCAGHDRRLPSVVRMSRLEPLPFVVSLLAVAVFVVAARPVRAETIFAVGTTWGAEKIGGGREASHVVARSTGDGWRPSNCPESLSSTAWNGVAFFDEARVWVFGVSLSDDRARLARSDDMGNTWSDISSGLPSEFGPGFLIADMKFVSSDRGWLVVSTRADVGPFLAETTDGGSTWSTISARSQSPWGKFWLAVRDGEAQLLRHDVLGASTETLATITQQDLAGNELPLANASSTGGAFLPPVSDDPAEIGPGNGYFMPRAADVIDSRVWIAGDASTELMVTHKSALDTAT